MIENPKPHNKWLGGNAKPCQRDLLRAAIYAALSKARDEAKRLQIYKANAEMLLRTDAEEQRQTRERQQGKIALLCRAQPNGNRSFNRGLGESFPNKQREISGCRKSPCSSSLYKRRHCLPSVTAQTRLLLFNKCLWLHKQKIKSHHSSTRSAISLASLTASAS